MTSGAFKSLWLEQDGNVLFLQKYRTFKKKKMLHRMMNKDCASVLLLLFLFNLRRRAVV